MRWQPLVSIIIPLYVISERFFKDFQKFSKLKYNNFEIIVVCDKNVSLLNIGEKVKLLLTHQTHTGPAEKRDLAIKIAEGEICAFIDDDAYPHPDWVKNAVKWFASPNIVAVGGPGLTPPEDLYWQKIGGLILMSYFGSGGLRSRFYPGGRYFVKDHPAYNLFVRTDVLKKVGGWGSTFYGGEDTFLCMKLIQYGDIISTEDVIVYHHRRSFPTAHLKQIAGVGFHRGYFFKRFPETSRKIIYLLPSILTIGFFSGTAVSIKEPNTFLIPFLSVFSIIFLLGFVSVLRYKADFMTAFIATIGIILTHIVYGFFFVKGLFTKYLNR